MELMDKSTANQIRSIVSHNQNDYRNLVWKFKPNAYVHFGEVSLFKKINSKKKQAPIVTIAIDKINYHYQIHNHKKGYLVSSTSFYCDFSKVTPQFLLPVQKMVREINLSICTPVKKNSK